MASLQKKVRYLLEGAGCLECAKLSNTPEKEEFIEKASRIHQNKYDYSNINLERLTKEIEINCPKHGLFLQKPYLHLIGYGCKTCGYKKNKENRNQTIEQVIQRSKKIHGDRYTYDINYGIVNKKIRIKCKKHGWFYQKFVNHYYGQGCLKCNSTPNEQAIHELLDKNRIVYEPEYKLTNKSMARYDIYVISKVLIEYDELEHFYINKKIVLDRKKDLFAIKNNVSLIRIAYNSNMSTLIETIQLASESLIPKIFLIGEEYKRLNLKEDIYKFI